MFYKKNKEHLRGLESEKIVIDYFLDKGFTLLGKRLRLKSAELDLLFKDKKQELTAVEVKSTTEGIEFASPISSRQKKRLTRAMLELESEYGRVPRAHLAAVSQFGKVFIYEDFLDTLE